jgi:hypothetical protein
MALHADIIVPESIYEELYVEKFAEKFASFGIHTAIRFFCVDDNSYASLSADSVGNFKKSYLYLTIFDGNIQISPREVK